MRQAVFENVIKPLLLRSGSLVAGALIGVGLVESDALTLANALVSLSCVCADLALRKIWVR